RPAEMACPAVAAGSDAATAGGTDGASQARREYRAFPLSSAGRQASNHSRPTHHIPLPPGRPCRTAPRPTRPRPPARLRVSTAFPRAPVRAPTGRGAPSARPHATAVPRSPAARIPAPPHRVPATAPRVPRSVRRLRATPTSTTTHAFSLPLFREFWLRPAIL